jgi:predicted nuclease with RNAse H fold
MTDIYLGIDVQLARGSSCAVLDEDGAMIATTWFKTPADASVWVAELARSTGAAPVIGIDAPRQPLTEPRAWHWNGRGRAWRARGGDELGHGRHCEVVLSAHNLANPPWTPLAADVPPWMQLGFDLFDALSEYNPLEVFPTASYRLLRGQTDVRVELNFADFARGPKDMIDACVAATTVREFGNGRGEAVGNGDGLGSIVLPRPISQGRIAAVFEWPQSAIAAN